MKTVREWINELPESCRTQAIVNLNNPVCNPNKNVSDEHSDLIGDALIKAFRWSESAEGHEYWDAIYESLPHT